MELSEVPRPSRIQLGWMVLEMVSFDGLGDSCMKEMYS